MLNGEKRPWGGFVNLYEKEFTKVKSLVVLPGCRLSLQSHQKRQEHWVVVRGRATITIEDKVMVKNVGESVFIPIGAKHRLGNDTESDIELIEVQTGIYFGEDDIVRYEDDFNRG